MELGPGAGRAVMCSSLTIVNGNSSCLVNVRSTIPSARICSNEVVVYLGTVFVKHGVDRHESDGVTSRSNSKTRP